MLEEGRTIWAVFNNGADGDNWAANNVQTAGAGAMGWKIPWDSALATEIQQLDNVLK